MTNPQKILLLLTAGTLCAIGQSRAQIVLFDDFNNQSVPNTSASSIPSSVTGYWSSFPNNGASVTETAQGRLVFDAPGGTASGTTQTAPSRTTNTHAYLNFFAQPLEFSLNNVDLSATSNGSAGANGGVFQFGLSPVANASVNTNAADIIYFRIRPGNGEVTLNRRINNVSQTLLTTTWTGPLAAMTISLYLDSTNFNLSISSGAESYTSGITAHGLGAGTWDTSLGFGMWVQSFGSDFSGGGPAISASVDSLTVTVIPEPSTYALFLGTGLLALILYRRCRLGSANVQA